MSSGGGGRSGSNASKPPKRGRSYKSELRQQNRGFASGDFSRPTAMQLEKFALSIKPGHDYTAQPQTRYVHPATGAELRELFGSSQQLLESQRPREMDFTTPEWQSIVAAQRLREMPADRSTLAGAVKDTFYTVDGERRGVADVFDKIFNDPEAHFNTASKGFHSIIKSSEQTELSREYQHYKQYRTKKESTGEEYKQELARLGDHASEDEIAYRLTQLTEENKRILSLDGGSFQPIPEIEEEHWNELADGGTPSYLYQRSGRTFRESEMYRYVPFIGALYDALYVDHDDSPFKDLTVITQRDEHLAIQKSAQEVRDSIKELTPNSLSQMFLYDQGEYSEVEEARRIDLYFRQQYALLEDLSDQGILDVPLLSDASKQQALNTMKHHLAANVLPQAISPNSNGLPLVGGQPAYNDHTLTSLSDDTFFSSTLPTQDALDYRINQLVNIEAKGRSTPQQTAALSKLVQLRQQMAPSSDSHSPNKWSFRSSSMPPSAHPSFLSTSHSGSAEHSNRDQPLYSPTADGLLNTISSWLWGATVDKVDPGARAAFELAQLDIERDRHLVAQKIANDALTHQNPDTFGKSARELAAEHMHALNTGNYFKTNTPKGKLLDQIEKLQELLRNPDIAPHIKGQLKVYQQQAFLAYYQIDKDEKEGKFDPRYLKQQQDLRLVASFEADRARQLGTERFSVAFNQSPDQFDHWHDGSSHARVELANPTAVRLESDYATQRLARKENELSMLAKIGQGFGVSYNTQSNGTALSHTSLAVNSHQQQPHESLIFQSHPHPSNQFIPFSPLTAEFRPLYNYTEPPLYPVKRRFDRGNPILKSDITSLTTGNNISTLPSFHPCNEFNDLFRHCVMDHGDNVVPCRKQYKTLQTCQIDHPKNLDMSHPSPISPYYTAPDVDSHLFAYPRRPSRFLDKFTIDTTFQFD